MLLLAISVPPRTVSGHKSSKVRIKAGVQLTVYWCRRDLGTVGVLDTRVAVWPRGGV
ncbi:hypothetical protein GCM10022235_82650 [Kribbella ginsengisoli]|uniref:Uncharacterized protein n=1 Tax=Kribbella ginsengisoli TaxID=363865 RepID=A0ABP6Z4C3_9ACTN